MKTQSKEAMGIKIQNNLRDSEKKCDSRGIGARHNVWYLAKYYNPRVYNIKNVLEDFAINRIDALKCWWEPIGQCCT